jgi:hypothetical protein
MSQLILDAHVSASLVLRPLRRWITVRTLQELRPNEIVLDERIPEILLREKQPTFVTIDKDFIDPRWCNPSYCILNFALQDREQHELPSLLRALFHRPEFRTRTLRMGKVARVSTSSIEYWQFPDRERRIILWKPRRRRS